jgi:hypothetical protein
MKYFGEYLVSKGIVNDDCLVETLITQVRDLPSVAEILFEKKALPAKIFLRAFEVQHEKKVDFRQACRELSVWTEDLDGLVAKAVQERKTPLGQLLVKAGHTDITTLTKALDEFLSRLPSPSPKVPKGAAAVEHSLGVPSPATAESSLTSEPPLAPPPAIEVAVEQIPSPLAQSPVMNEVPSFLLDELFANLSETKLTEVHLLFNSIKEMVADPAMQEPLLKIALGEIHLVRGLLTATQLLKFDSIFSLLEMYYLKLIERVTSGAAIEGEGAGELGVLAVQMMKDLLDVLRGKPSEVAWFEDPSRDARFSTLFTRMSDACLGLT